MNLDDIISATWAHYDWSCSRSELERAVRLELSKQWQPPALVPDCQFIDALERACRPFIRSQS